MRNATVVAAGVALTMIVCAPAASRDLPSAQPEALGMSAERLARIDGVMRETVDTSRTAGVVVMVLRDGRVVKAGAWGLADREAQRPMTVDTLFRIASQTKAVTSVAAMMLVEEGRLRLGDPVQRWLPEFAQTVVADGDGGTVPAHRPITVRDLLTHSSGFSYGGEPAIRRAYEERGLGPEAGAGWYFADKDEPICTSMERLGGLPAVAQPGERFVYGYSTDLLGCLIERVAGTSLAEFFRERIFEPLAMDNTAFFLPEDARSRLAAVYAARSDGLVRAPEGASGQGAYIDGPRASYSGGAGLVSTVGDYGRFLQMLLNGGELDGVRILSPHTVALMTGDQLGDVFPQPGLGFGLGFQVVQDPALAGTYGAPGAYGWGGAYATSYWVDPVERVVGMIMTQTLPSGGLDVADRFRTLVYSAITEPAAAGR